jgi:hypothetical protein
MPHYTVSHGSDARSSELFTSRKQSVNHGYQVPADLMKLPTRGLLARAEDPLRESAAVRSFPNKH